jgi:seryl-tRNA synthetase
MLDVRWAREHPDALDVAMAKRGAEPVSAAVLALDTSRRSAQTRFQELQFARRDASKAIGQAKAKGEDASEAMAAVAKLKDDAAAAEIEAKQASDELEALLATLPNPPADDVPPGKDEDDNVFVRENGTPRAFTFTPKSHIDLGEPLGLDFEAGVKLSGARFVAMRGQIARLERALAHFMLDLHVQEHDYAEIRPPVLVRSEAMYGTGQLPKFEEDSFQTTDGRWLIPTAEVPLTNLAADTSFDPPDLPLRFVAHTPCFRSEAGAAGKDTRGLIRMHQFDKVEMVSIVAADQSETELERMTGAAEMVLQRLELPYRVILLCAGDMGFGARKTYDLEVWVPSQDKYREISSCSTCGDFQARRMGARVKRTEGKGTDFAHTLNGSGVAVGRAMVALLENHQREDGSIGIPAALQPYLGGMTELTPGQG